MRGEILGAVVAGWRGWEGAWEEHYSYCGLEKEGPRVWFSSGSVVG